MNENKTLFNAICCGDRNTVVEIIQNALDNNEDVGFLLDEIMIPAMGEVGERFSRSEIFVPEMLVAARAMQGGMDIIEPMLAGKGHEPVGKVCIGSVMGDLHDIGKNLVVIMLKGAGFEVEDLGVDVDLDDFESAVERGAQVVCLSALLTTTKGEMVTVVEHFKEREDVKVVIGGAVVTQEYADEIGADAYGKDATDAVRVIKACVDLIAEKLAASSPQSSLA